MTDNELRHLNRRELLELLIAVTHENTLLKEECGELRQKLDDWVIRSEEAGSLAEAALRLNGVFEAAQAAADQYLDSVRSADTYFEEKRQETEEKAAFILNAARSRAAEIEEQAGQRAAEIRAQAERDAAEIAEQAQMAASRQLRSAERQAQDYLAAVNEQLRAYSEERKQSGKNGAAHEQN